MVVAGGATAVAVVAAATAVVAAATVVAAAVADVAIAAEATGAAAKPGRDGRSILQGEISDLAGNFTQTIAVLRTLAPWAGSGTPPFR
jgi:hypothetical protein